MLIISVLFCYSEQRERESLSMLQKHGQTSVYCFNPYNWAAVAQG